MRVLVSAKGGTLDSSVSPVFGRAPWFILVDSEDMSHESFENPAADQSSGAGIMAAQFVLGKKPETILSSNIGPKAFEVLNAGSVDCYSIGDGSVRNAVQAMSEGTLIIMSRANAGEHSGLSPAMEHSVNVSGDEEKLAELTEKLRELRSQVALIMEELEKLGKVD